MKKTIALVVASFLLCNSFAARAEKAPTAQEVQTAVGVLQAMPAEQKQQVIEAGIEQMQDLTPEQIKQYKAAYDALPPEQKKQIEAQVLQQLETDPQLKDKAAQKLNALSPEQQRELGSH